MAVWYVLVPDEEKRKNDIIHEATDWFPYAKPTGGAAWNTATGEKL